MRFGLSNRHVRFTLEFILGLITALVITAIVIEGLGGDAVKAYRIFFLGAVWSPKSLGESLIFATPLILTGLAMVVAYNARFWNIGGEGQLQVGAVFSAGIGLVFLNSGTTLSPLIGIPLVIVMGFAGGAVWGGLAGVLKVKFNVNEIISTLMLNFVALLLVSYLDSAPWRDVASFNLSTPPMPSFLWLPIILPGTNLHFGFVISLLFVPLVYFLLKYTIFGYRLKAIGNGLEAARYGGINVGKNILLLAALSGGIAGIAGAGEIFGVDHLLTDGFSLGYGFTGIIVAFLGKNSPVGTCLIAILFGVLINGGFAMQQGAAVPLSVSQFMQGTTLIATIGYGLIFERRRGMVP